MFGFFVWGAFSAICRINLDFLTFILSKTWDAFCVFLWYLADLCKCLLLLATVAFAETTNTPRKHIFHNVLSFVTQKSVKKNCWNFSCSPNVTP